MIRKAKNADLFNLVALAKEFAAEAKYIEISGAEFDAESALKTLFRHVNNQSSVVLVSAGEDGKTLDGLLLGVIVPWFLNYNRKFACELIFYVKKGSRNGFVSRSLLNHFEKICREAGASIIELGTGDRMDGTRVSKLFKRLGFEHCRNGHVKRLGA